MCEPHLSKTSFNKGEEERATTSTTTTGAHVETKGERGGERHLKVDGVVDAVINDVLEDDHVVLLAAVHALLEERRAADHHLEEQHAQGPPVDRLVVPRPQNHLHRRRAAGGKPRTAVFVGSGRGARARWHT